MTKSEYLSDPNNVEEYAQSFEKYYGCKRCADEVRNTGDRKGRCTCDLIVELGFGLAKVETESKK